MSLRRSPAALGAATALVLAIAIPQTAAADHRDDHEDHTPGHVAAGQASSGTDAHEEGGQVTPAGEAVEDGKVWVCKFIRTPGSDEQLKDGENPIHVSADTLRNVDGIDLEDISSGDQWTDAQERSIIVTGEDDPRCQTDTTGDDSDDSDTEVGAGGGENGNGNGNGNNGDDAGDGVGTDEDPVRPAGEAVEDGKVWVCKFIRTPGGDEQLKDGKNPIHVSADTLRNVDGIDLEDISSGDQWTDAQERSIIVTGEDDPRCQTDTTGDDSDDSDTEVGAGGGENGNGNGNGNGEGAENGDSDGEGGDDGTEVDAEVDEADLTAAPRGDDATDDEVAVLAEVFTRGGVAVTATSPEGEGDVEVLAAVQRREELPRTGMSTLALALSGLFALGTGTTAVARTGRRS